MKYPALQFGIVAVACMMIAGCATIEPEPPRAIITFKKRVRSLQLW